MSRVLIADDHEVVRAGYRQFLEAEPSITEIGEAGSVRTVLSGRRYVSESLAQSYRSRILEKMNFRSNAAMTSYALRNGLVQ
jgi:DNA-binding NarL/FixJ family response regulator